MSVMARCAATPSTCDSANDETACTSVATPAAAASGISRSARCFPMTSSMSHFDVAGSTRPAIRFTSIKARPRPSRPRRAHTSAFASFQAADVSVVFFAACGAAGLSPPRVCRNPRDPSDFGSLSPIPIGMIS